MTVRDLTLRLRALISPRRVERELDEELAFHIDRETQKLVDEGMPLEEARVRARARFGSVTVAADACRDARGTQAVDTTLRDVLYAFRSFRRAPLAAVTIVGTVALGLGLVAVVFSFFNAFLFREDAVRDPHELFTVERMAHAGAGERISFTRPEFEALRREIAPFSDAFATVRGLGTRIEGKRTNGALVSGNFFEMLGVRAMRGRTFTAADEQSGRLVVVLSSRGWRKLFAGSPGIVGRSIAVNGVPAEVIGIMPDDFRGLSLGPPDYWAPLALGGQIRKTHAGRENEIAVDVVARLRPGTTRDAALAALTAWGAPAHFRMRPRRGTLQEDTGEALLVFSPLFFAFGLILLIGCANVANLLLARGLARQREIGIRLSLGASRRRVVRQLLTESLLLAFAAAACGLLLSRVLLDIVLRVIVATMPPEIAESINVSAPPADWRVVMFVVAGAILSTLVFGLLPALQATRLELVRTMRGEITRDARPGRAKNLLVGVQVTASALLLISAAVFLRSALTLSAQSPAVRTSDTLMVDVDNEALRGQMLDALRSHPSVSTVGASAPQALGMPWSTSAEAPASAARSGVGYKYVSPEYFDVLGIDLLRGRTFTPDEAGGQAGVVVISETGARRLWPGRDAVGETIRLERMRAPGRADPSDSPGPPRTFTVIGIVRDVRSALASADMTDALVYVPITTLTPGAALTLRVHGDPGVVRGAIVERLTEVDPALGEVMTVRTMAGLEAYVMRLLFWGTVALATLALTLTLSGLFGVLSYLVEQRAREIGVRMALGATTRDVARLVLGQLTRPLLVGLAAGAALALAVATVLLTTGAAEELGGVVRLFDPVAYAASMTCIIVACVLAASVPALRAARIDPIAVLRRD